MTELEGMVLEARLAVLEVAVTGLAEIIIKLIDLVDDTEQLAGLAYEEAERARFAADR